ncbi:MAG TPA: YihY/virulence factor BrkB family protein [Pyrinomonadaceae bacterium]|nr:YihY/virulence factor BrkB family protein [Pyrinomonadaceae bacterium]
MMNKEELKGFLKRLYDRFFKEDLTSSAAQVGFFFTFALFPLLLFLISLFGMVLESAEELKQQVFFYLAQIMPTSAYNLVQETVQEVTEGSSGGKLTLGFLVALWSASAGVDSLRGALNNVYNYEERRSIWKTRGTSVIVTLALALLITIAVGGVFYGWRGFMHLLEWMNIPSPPAFVLMVVQWIIVFAVLVAVFALLYNFLPHSQGKKWQWITPGAVTGIILWVLVSYAFRVYLSYFDSYNATYGSLGAVIILLLWLYLTALVILVGALINSVLEDISREKAGAPPREEIGQEEAEKPAEERAEETDDARAENTDKEIFVTKSLVREEKDSEETKE